MQTIISRLLHSFDNGKLSRRELMQGLTVLAAAGSSASAAGFQGDSINHVSLTVADMKRSSEFYQRVFGCTVLNQDADTIRLAAGKGHISLRKGNPSGRVDHFAVGINSFDKDSVIRNLKQRGATPVEEPIFGLNVKDPDGIPVQVSADS